jgi:transposase-like protein
VEIGLGESTLANWMDVSREGASGEGPVSVAERDESRTLRAENREVQMQSIC